VIVVVSYKVGGSPRSQQTNSQQQLQQQTFITSGPYSSLVVLLYVHSKSDKNK
jgi:hypothetical protein